MMKSINEIQIHIFCDSSIKAYGAVVYVRVLTKDGYEISFLISKSRVAPLKKKTIPIIELLAALIAIHLGIMVRDVLISTGKKIEMIF